MFMHAQKLVELPRQRRVQSHNIMLFLFLGMTTALAGNVYQLVRGEHLKQDLVQMQRNTQSQISRLNAVSAAMLEENQQRFEAIKKQLQESTPASSK